MDKVRLYKILPRAAFMLMLLLVWEVADWFMDLADPTNAQAGFASGALLAAVGFFKFFMTDGEFKD